MADPSMIGGGDDQSHLLAKSPEPIVPSRRVSHPMIPLSGDDRTHNSTRASTIGGEPAFMNPPRYPLNMDGNISPPPVGRELQPQFYGIALQTWQDILSYVLPHARLHGMPGESEVPPGLSGPLNPEERAALQALLDQP